MGEEGGEGKGTEGREGEGLWGGGDTRMRRPRESQGKVAREGQTQKE